MASHSPAGTPQQPTVNDETRPYYYGWAAMTRMMLEGYTWSGMERDCAFLNLGNGRFVDVSAVSGLDFIDDGRAAATTDWDGDGDLDIWLKNRSGPQLRFLRNESAAGQHWLGLRLAGVTCNRDAVGARVEVHAGGRRLIRSVNAGDGYLSHSSRTLLFGLGSSDKVERILIHWPRSNSSTTDGPWETQEVSPLVVDRNYTVRQGGEPTPIRPRGLAPLAAGPVHVPDASISPARMVLREPLPTPPSLETAIRPSTDTPLRLVSLWAQWCAPCVEELRELRASADALKRAGVEVIALNVDRAAERERAERLLAERVMSGGGPPLRNVMADEGLIETLDALVLHLRGKPGAWPLPMSFLVDAEGSLQVAYIGRITPEALLADSARYQAPPTMSQRTAFPGRWYYRIDRDYAELARDLKRRGRDEDAAAYAGRARGGGGR